MLRALLEALLFLSFVAVIQTKVDPTLIYASVDNENEPSSLRELVSIGQPYSRYKIANETQDFNKTYKIGFVEPVFTYAAYNNNSFYNFYHKYKDTKPNVEITHNIGLLRGNGIPEGPFMVYNAKAGAVPTIPYIDYFSILKKNVEQMVPAAIVNNITDIDVHFGRIFNLQNHSNVYDILFIFHSEYVTQEEYDNLRLFVLNGGTIVFTEANALYAEIEYDATRNSVTLVKGHNWEFNGFAAKKSVAERWPEETGEWTGSNFMYGKPTFIDLDFLNLPFNYTHSEEQHITNSHASVLHNYGVHDPKDNAFNATVATYEMDYGKGKVIGIGLYGHTLVGQEGFESFLKLFDYIIIPHSLQTKGYKPIGGNNKDIISVPSIMQTGEVSVIEVNRPHHVLTLNLNRSTFQHDNLTISIPRSLIDPSVNVAFEASTESYDVVAGGKRLSFDYIILDTVTGFEISIPQNTTRVQVHYSLPTFSIHAPKDISMEAQGENTTVPQLGKPKINCNNNHMESGLCENITVTNNAPTSFPIGSTYVSWVASDPFAGASVKDLQKITIIDNIRPDVVITQAEFDTGSDNSSLLPVDILDVRGSAYDRSGIDKVEAFVYTLPFDGQFSYRPAAITSQGNSSSWSISLEVLSGGDDEVGVTVRATDKAGNRNWDKGIFSVP